MSLLLYFIPDIFLWGLHSFWLLLLLSKQTDLETAME